MSGTLFPSGPEGYGKLSKWPAFAAWLADRYNLEAERVMLPVRSVGRVVVPAGYRLYVLRPSAGGNGDGFDGRGEAGSSLRAGWR